MYAKPWNQPKKNYKAQISDFGTTDLDLVVSIYTCQSFLLI